MGLDGSCSMGCPVYWSMWEWTNDRKAYQQEALGESEQDLSLWQYPFLNSSMSKSEPVKMSHGGPNNSTRVEQISECVRG